MIQIITLKLVLLIALVALLFMAVACILWGYTYDGRWMLAATAFSVSGARLLWLDFIGYGQ